MLHKILHAGYAINVGRKAGKFYCIVYRSDKTALLFIVATWRFDVINVVFRSRRLIVSRACLARWRRTRQRFTLCGQYLPLFVAACCFSCLRFRRSNTLELADGVLAYNAADGQDRFRSDLKTFIFVQLYSVWQ